MLQFSKKWSNRRLFSADICTCNTEWVCINESTHCVIDCYRSRLFCLVRSSWSWGIYALLKYILQFVICDWGCCASFYNTWYGIPISVFRGKSNTLLAAIQWLYLNIHEYIMLLNHSSRRVYLKFGWNAHCSQDWYSFAHILIICAR